MATLTPEALTALLVECDLLDEELLAELRQVQPLFRDTADFMDEIVHRGWLTRFQADQVLAGRAKDLSLGGYRILSPVGEGGMGQVYKAEQRRLGRVVALKVIHHDYLANRPEAVRRFHREARAAAQLAHPNAIRIYDADQDGQRHFIVMEYVEGLDLARLVEFGGPLSIAAACDYIAQAALGLQHAHELGVIHRDIKPSNLLVTRVAIAGGPSGVLKGPRSASGHSGNLAGQKTEMARLADELRRQGLVKILDLGLARAAHQAGVDSALTMEGNVMGTPDYIAPEQARDPHGVDGRADIYSLGCTFYFALTGRPPFPKSSAMEKLLMHQCDEPLPVEAHRPKVPESVGKVIRRMMAKTPPNRFQSAMEVYQALSAVAAELAPSSSDALNLGGVEAGTQTTPVCDVMRLPSSSPSGLSPAGKTPAVPVMFKPPTLSDIKLTSESMADAQAPLADPNVVPAVPNPPEAREWKSLEGVRPSEEKTKEAQGFSLDLNWGDEPPSTVEGQLATPAQDSVPDLPAVVDTVRERKLDSGFTPEPAASGTPLAQLEGHAGCVLALSFSADGRLLVSGGVDGTLRLWRVDNGEFTIRAALHALGGEVHAVAFSRDSRLLGYGTATGHAWVCSLDEGQVGPTMANELVRPGCVAWNSVKRSRDGSVIRQGHIPAVPTIAFAPDGNFVALGAARSLHLFNLAGEEPRHWIELTSHLGDVQSVLFGGDDKHLASTSKDETLRLWEPFRYFGKLQTTLKVPNIGCLAYSRDGKQLAFASGSRSVQIWGVAGKQPERLARFDQLQEKIRLLQFLNGDRHLLAVDEQGHAWIRDLNTGALVSQQSFSFLKAYSLAVSPDGAMLAAGNIDGSVSIHSLGRGQAAPLAEPVR